MSVLKSKVFWVAVLTILIQIGNQAEQQNIIPLKIISYVAFVILALTAILTQIQNMTLKKKLGIK